MGLLSGGPIYAQRILSVPGSALADDLRMVASGWQQRVPEEISTVTAEEFAAAKREQTEKTE